MVYTLEEYGLLSEKFKSIEMQTHSGFKIGSDIFASKYYLFLQTKFLSIDI